MGLIILILVAAGIGTLLIIAAGKPNHFRYQRSATIAAAPQAVFDQVADFHKWQAWSPWERIDPSLQREYSGPEHGVGAAYGWKGTGKAGAGRMEIIEAAPGAKVLIRLDFIKPFKQTNTAEFIFQPVGQPGGHPQGDATVVTWAMYGPQPFVSKVMGTLFNMDDLIGKDFESGLNNLRLVVEPEATEAKKGVEA